MVARAPGHCWIVVTLLTVFCGLTLVSAKTQDIAQQAEQEQKEKGAPPVTADAIVDQDAVERGTTYVDARDVLSHPASLFQSTAAISIPLSGAATPYPAALVMSGFTGTIGRLGVRLHTLSHTLPADLDILLVGPGGQKVMLMSDVGGSTDVTDISLTIQDEAAPFTASALVSGGVYAPTDLAAGENLPAPAPAGPYGTSLSAFNGTSPNGTWRLYVADDTGVDYGSLFGSSLIISPQTDFTTPYTIPDVSGTVANLFVSDIPAPISKVTVSLYITHPFSSDLDISLSGPGGTTVELTTDNGGSGDNYGNSCAASGRTNFDDTALTSIVLAGAPFVGTFHPEGSLAAFNGKSANGPWILTVADDLSGDIGTVQCWSLAISYDENTTLQAPTGLHATQITGNQVTLRWTAPTSGIAPNNYLLEGGTSPGTPIASISTGSTAPIFTFTAPTGLFYVRLKSLAGGSESGASNEIPIAVNVPVAPTAPDKLLLTTTGSTLSLGWRNSFGGGAPSSLLLDVTGDVTASVPLPLSESFSFIGVPAGNYTFRIGAVNGTGTVAFSNPRAATFPQAGCLGAPGVPVRFLAYKTGTTVNLIWESPESAGAPSSFILKVTGAFTGDVPIAERSISAPVPNGTYNFSVAATNACGTSAYTPVQTLTIP